MKYVYLMIVLTLLSSSVVSANDEIYLENGVWKTRPKVNQTTNSKQASHSYQKYGAYSNVFNTDGYDNYDMGTYSDCLKKKNGVGLYFHKSNDIKRITNKGEETEVFLKNGKIVSMSCNGKNLSVFVTVRE